MPESTPKLEELYKRMHSADPTFTDEELDFLINEMSVLNNKLRELNFPAFELMRNQISKDVHTLNMIKFHREN